MHPDRRAIPWLHAPLAAVAGCFALGVALAEALGGPVALWLAGGLLFGGAALVGSGWDARRLVSVAPLVTTVALGGLALAVGGSRYLTWMHVPTAVEAAIATCTEQPTTVHGRLMAFPQRRGDRLHLLVGADSLACGTPMSPFSGRLSVWVDTAAAPGLRDAPRGTRLYLAGRLRPLPLRRNPAEFDYGAYLERRRIVAVLDVPATDRSRGTSAVHGAPEAAPGGWHTVARLRRAVRQAIAETFERASTRSLVLALLLGDRSGLETTTREAFARTGLLHVLAISGLHVMLVGFLLYGLLGPLSLRLGMTWWRMEAVRTSLTLCVLAGYVLMSGGAPSALRAGLMGALWLGSTLVQRPTSSFNTLGLAACVLLWFAPASLFDLGFQLSFAAVAALLLLTGPLLALVPARRRAHPAARWTAGMAATSIAATLGTLPVLLHHLGTISLGGLVLNFLALPLTAGALLVALLAVTASMVMPGVGVAFGSVADGLAQGLLAVVIQGDAWLPVLHQSGLVTTRLALLSMGLGLAAVAAGRRARLRWRCVLMGGLVLVTSLVAGLATGAYRPQLDVIFFDVGQGDAALVTLPNGRHLLIDAGPRTPYSDAGEQVILRHLDRYGIEALDAVVITHPHSDHLGGLPTLLRAGRVRRVVHPGAAYRSHLVDETEHLLDSLRVPTGPVHPGDTLALDPQVQIQVLAAGPGGVDAGAVNDASVIVRLAYGSQVFLFLGDAEAPAEARLAQSYDAELLRASVVKVGHHGSPTSSSAPLLQAVGPVREIPHRAVFSAGRRNRFGFPDASVVASWTQLGALPWTTGTDGALWLTTDGNRRLEVVWR